MEGLLEEFISSMCAKRWEWRSQVASEDAMEIARALAVDPKFVAAR